MAYTTDGTANFNFFINRQGPRGPQGVQGPEGFSPKVEVEEDYGNTFTLRVTNKDSSFVTSNLREHKEDRGGTYVRWDRETEQMYLGDAGISAATDSTAGIIRISDSNDIATKNNTTAITPKQLIENIDTVKEELQTSIDANTQLINSLKSQVVTLEDNQIVRGEKTFSHLITDRIYSEVQGKMILTTYSDSVEINTNLDVNGIIRNSNGIVIDDSRLGKTLVKNEATEKYDVRVATDSLTGIVKPDGTTITINENGIISATAKEPDIATVDKAGIVKPDGNTITITEDGTISSIAQGDVTAAGDNNFTGLNTFSNVILYNTTIPYSNNAFVDIYDETNHRQRLKAEYGQLFFGALDSSHQTTLQLRFEEIKNGDARLLTTSNVTAGDNISLALKNGGIEISSTASGGAEIDDTTAATDKVYSSSKTQELINELQSTIAALQTRVQSLENMIDGGNAGSTYPVELQKFSEKVSEGISINEQINSFSEDVQINEE